MTTLSQFLHTKPGLSFQGKKNESVVVVALSKLVACDGCLFHAQHSALYIAEGGSTGFVYLGSIGLARAGSKIYGSGGAVIFAQKGAWVRATDGDTVYCEDGAEVVPTSGAIVVRISNNLEHPLFSAKDTLFDLPQPQAV